MSPRRPRTWFDPSDFPVLLSTPTVDERAPPQPSGLLDAKGNPLFRPREPVGFAIPKVTR